MLKGFTAAKCAYNGQPDRPYSTLMFKWAGTAGQRKLIYLSGVPDDVIVDPFGPVFQNPYSQAINSWVNFIIGTPPLGWIGTSGNGATKFPLQIIGAGPNASVTAAGSNFAANSIVYVGGMRGMSGYRGQFSVVSSAGGVSVLQGYNPPAALANPKGYIQQVNYAFIPANQVQTIVETHRNRGKGINLPVGRRKARSH